MTAAQTPTAVRRTCAAGCGRSTTSKTGTCTICVPTPRVERRCVKCKKVTTAKAGICRRCKAMQPPEDLTGEPSYEHALTGGRWVRDRRGIARWEPYRQVSA